VCTSDCGTGLRGEMYDFANLRYNIFSREK
jgi:hypothetical protein